MGRPHAALVWTFLRSHSGAPDSWRRKFVLSREDFLGEVSGPYGETVCELRRFNVEFRPFLILVGRVLRDVGKRLRDRHQVYSSGLKLR
jgi:hypothetical protein